MTEWPTEEIPEVQCVFLRVHRNNQKEGNLNFTAFQASKPAMSTDWCKYAEPKRTQGAAKKPQDNGVVRIRVEDILKIEGLSVEHTPDWPSNRAHTDVVGDKDEEVRVKLRHACSWVVDVPPKE